MHLLTDYCGFCLADLSCRKPNQAKSITIGQTSKVLHNGIKIIANEAVELVGFTNTE